MGEDAITLPEKMLELCKHHDKKDSVLLPGDSSTPLVMDTRALSMAAPSPVSLVEELYPPPTRELHQDHHHMFLLPSCTIHTCTFHQVHSGPYLHTLRLQLKSRHLHHVGLLLLHVIHPHKEHLRQAPSVSPLPSLFLSISLSGTACTTSTR